MEVHFTPEQEVRLTAVANAKGISSDQFVQDAVLHFLEDENFRAEVQKGIKQADQGMFIEEAEMDARVARILNA